MAFQIFPITPAASENEEPDAAPLREVDSEKKLIRFLLHEAEKHEDFQIDYVQNAEDAADLACEMDLCEEGLELDYYSELAQTKTFPVLGILRYETDAKILKGPEIGWFQLAEELLELKIESKNQDSPKAS